jgi:NAD(P)-dependent dehydrogenase (short-subunit alcohol dehydrogenase family)
MDFGLAGERVLVTAGAGGIGRSIARRFLAEGARVVVCDVDEAALDDCRAQTPEVVALRADVASSADVADLFASAQENFAVSTCW